MEAAMIKACIFDLDGTLTNTLDSLEYSVNETMKEIGMPQITKEQCRQFVGDGAKVLLERTLKAGGDTKLWQSRRLLTPAATGWFLTWDTSPMCIKF